jgi:AcrR family transcriptional regulator
MAPALSTRARLDETAWIEAALATLAHDGVSGVRVERLAAALGVTKGSFYWHFKDREDLLQRTLDAWAKARIAAIGLQAAHRGAPAQILEMMLDIYTRKPNPKGLGVELAIRGFARSHRGAASCIARVDDARLAEVGGLFARLGLPQAEAKARALLFYAFLFGQSLLGGKRRTDALSRAARTVLAVSPRAVSRATGPAASAPCPPDGKRPAVRPAPAKRAKPRRAE